MYLVDTSAWIEALSKSPRPAGLALIELRKREAPVFLTGVILQEILQGVRDDFTFQRYQSLLTAQQFVHPLNPVATYAEAARLYIRCRKSGVTPRSPTDCLIAQLAIEHGLTLLHDDRDYEKIAKVEPRLKLV
ncbi:MAG: type II toxin-antitoxin system VapC family toxin [Stenotrophobium sp.]